MSEVKLRRYVKRSTREDPGWAIVVIGSDGYFSACSDYGDYAYLWSHHGRDDFRSFLAEARRDDYYFVSKLSPKREYDPEGTRDNIKRHIIELRREDRLTREKAREEWDYLEDLSIDNEVELQDWMTSTDFEYPYEWAPAYCYNRQAAAFVDRIMADWLAPLLREEMEKEAA